MFLPRGFENLLWDFERPAPNWPNLQYVFDFEILPISNECLQVPNVDDYCTVQNQKTSLNSKNTLPENTVAYNSQILFFYPQFLSLSLPCPSPNPCSSSLPVPFLSWVLVCQITTQTAQYGPTGRLSSNLPVPQPKSFYDQSAVVAKVPRRPSSPVCPHVPCLGLRWQPVSYIVTTTFSFVGLVAAFYFISFFYNFWSSPRFPRIQLLVSMDTGTQEVESCALYRERGAIWGISISTDLLQEMNVLLYIMKSKRQLILILLTAKVL